MKKKTWIKRLAAMALAGTLVFSLAACGGGNSGGAPAGNDAPGGTSQNSGGDQQSTEEKMASAGIQVANSETGNTQVTDETLVVELSALPDFLWAPGAGQNGTNEEQIIGGAIFDRLIDYDFNAKKAVPCLATSWEWVSPTELKLNLRDDVTMSDGSPFVADDVVYSVKVWMEQCASNDTGAYLAGATANDEHTVTIEFNVVAPALVNMLSWVNFSIVSEDEVNALGGLEAASKKPVMGCGKYVFKEWVSGQYITLERNDNYWNPDYKGYFKTIKIIPVGDTGAKASAVQAGDAQVAYDMPVSQAASFAQNPQVRTYVYAGGEIEHLFFNMGEGHPTSDIRVRQAIDKALNYDAIAGIATAGYGKPVYSYVSDSATYYTPGYTAEEMAIDVEGAKALLAEAGYPDGLTISTVTLPDLADVYTVMQQNLAAIGVELKIENVDMGAFVQAMLFDKAYDIVAVSDSAADRTPQLDQFVRGGIVFGGPNATLDTHVAVLQKLMKASSDADAKAALQEYDALNKTDVMCTNLYMLYKSSLVGADIKGFAVRERAYIDITSLYK